MAITGTKYSNANKTLKNYFVNDCTINDVQVMDSQYADLSLKLLLEDDNNGYTYTCFVNQKFEKDNNGVVTGLSYPDDLNTLFVASKCDLNVSDNGVLDTKSLESLTGKKVSCVTYRSTGKYKRQTWGVLSSPETKEQLESRFNQQISKGYPKDYDKGTSNNDPVVQQAKETFAGEEIPF